MPFWRRRSDQPTEPGPIEPALEPEDVPPDWEPDPSDFDDPVETADVPDALEVAEPAPAPVAVELADPVELAQPIPPSSLHVEIPAFQPLVEPAPMPSFAAEGAPPAAPVADDGAEGSLDTGLERTRGGFMSRLRGLLGTSGPEGPSWDDVEET